MDDTTTLVSELLNKLADLDQKVYNYRQDMANEFQRYSRHLLHDVPEHVSTQVEEAVADKLHNYSALSPAFALDSASADLGRSAVGRWTRRRTGVSPPPVLPHTSGVPPHDVASGSPSDRDRERELHGLFTPIFLPLLEVMPPNRNVSTPTTISPPVTSQDIESRPTQTPSPHLQLDSTTQRPGPVRHYTEETTSSTASDDSLSRTRRSALRRSSSASIKDIQSPRRVRFDVEGEEVLPTVSPPTPSLNCSIHDLPTSPQSEEQIIPAHGPLNHEVFEDETTILGNSPPGPKKISSTERLKALARSSTEDTSKWTLVGDIHDDDEEEEGIIMLSSKKKPIAPVPELIAATAFENGAGPHYTQDNSPKEIGKEIRHDENTDEAVDDLLGLTPLSSFKDKKRFSPPQEAQKVVQEVSPDADLESQRVLSQSSGPSDPVLISQSKDQNYEEEAMFSFDDDEPALQSQTINITPEHEEQEEIEVHETSTPWTDNLAEKVPVSLYSTSPAISAARPASLRATSPASSLSKRMSASAGSYKGKPFLIGVVRDEELHKRAAEMGDLLHFVGSVDGRSGVDPSDSYHQAPYYSHGTPRSLGERLMEENAHRIANNALRRD